MSSRQKVERWCFTINNPTDACHPGNWSDIKAAIWQLEQGSTPHVQGCVWFNKRMRLSALKKVHPLAHWEPAKSWKASVMYCAKQKTKIGLTYQIDITVQMSAWLGDNNPFDYHRLAPVYSHAMTYAQAMKYLFAHPLPSPPPSPSSSPSPSS